MNQLTFTTRQAGRYLGVEPHVLQSNFQRHGNYLGIVPSKGNTGRLVWPASEVRDAALPALHEQPDGAALLVKWLIDVCPAIEPKDAHRIALAWLGSEALPGWNPLPSQTEAVLLAQELPLALMGLQAVLDRIDHFAADRPTSRATREFAAVLIRRLSYIAAEAGEAA